MALNPAEHYALKLLAQREHSALELRRKLARKSYNDHDIIPLLNKLKMAGWQDDTRFARSYILSRQSRGYGPLRISKELNERGITEEIIQQTISEQACTWLETIVTVARKKFGYVPTDNFTERAKQFRFLQYRGFTQGQIKHCLKELGS